MDLVLKIAGIGIIVAVLQQTLSRSGRDEYALLTVLAGIIAVITLLVREASGLLESFSFLMDF
ncbi:MAG: SpoIIIAC/SpoIIIAD family protein [Acutalibacteraceae bacterium]|nr:stage III sporulation protein AC [Clostridia bacterium]MEE0980648.1 SpoIIIAC/SpoIIIAD family protein [Acutalibacteraceae bacterium]